MKIQELANPVLDAAADEAAILAVLLWFASPQFAQQVRAVLENPKAQTLEEIAAAIGFPPAIFRLLHVYFAQVAKEPREEAPAPDQPGGKAILDAIVKASPMDAAMTEAVRRFASLSFHNRACALAQRSSARTVEEIAAILGLQPASVQIEIGARLVDLTGEATEIQLGDAANGAIMQMRPEKRPTMQ